ncbi:acyl-CoA thioesterase [Oceanobacillus saliphilus]|uniref:acyl-CoA thioesterase n=1 Tax=Oceanobacillus saliphilus TaxID=2925834 RepID=UPI00201D6E31|nr:thioesterase family protein [Oceanobacillus saliphilus]
MRKVNYIENMEQWRSEFKFYIPVKVRFSETDMYGHVNNVSPFIYFEEARIDYIQHTGLMTDMVSKDGAVIVGDLQCDYLQQIYFNEKLKLYVKTDSVGNSSFDLHYMGVKENDEIAFTGRGRMVYINPQTGRPQPLSEEKKRLLVEN